jgi:hypothetical protein
LVVGAHKKHHFIDGFKRSATFKGMRANVVVPNEVQRAQKHEKLKLEPSGFREE